MSNRLGLQLVAVVIGAVVAIAWLKYDEYFPIMKNLHVNSA